MRCTTCYIQNPETNVYCNGCGADLRVLKEQAIPAAQVSDVADRSKISMNMVLFIIGAMSLVIVVLAALVLMRPGQLERSKIEAISEPGELPPTPGPATSVTVVHPPANAEPTKTPVLVAPFGEWSGDWSTPTGAYLTIEVHLVEMNSQTVNGRIEWTLRRTTRADKADKVGLSATEYVRGRYDPDTQTLTMSGYRKDDPYEVLVMLDDYRLNLSKDGRYLRGSAKNGGKWNGRVNLSRQL